MGHFYSDGKFICCNDAYMELYIPLMYFDEMKRYATDYSSYIDTLGLIRAGLFENGKLKEYKMLNHPYSIRVYVYESEQRIIDFPNEGPTPCRVLSFTKDSKIMDEAIIQDGQNALDYLDMILDGKVPNAVPYDKASDLWEKNQSMNNVGFGVRSEVKEMIIALHYRNPNDLGETFAKVYGKDLSISPTDYATASTRQICQYASTFSSITFEDIDSAITTSINRSRNNGTDNYSPVEDVIKM